MFTSDTFSRAALPETRNQNRLIWVPDISIQPRRQFSQRTSRDQPGRSSLRHRRASGADPSKKQQGDLSSTSDVTDYERMAR